MIFAVSWNCVLKWQRKINKSSAAFNLEMITCKINSHQNLSFIRILGSHRIDAILRDEKLGRKGNRIDYKVYSTISMRCPRSYHLMVPFLIFSDSVQAYFLLNRSTFRIHLSVIRNKGKMDEEKVTHGDIAFALARKIDNAMSARETRTATSMVRYKNLITRYFPFAPRNAGDR